jgi:hypothetical protein
MKKKKTASGEKPTLFRRLLQVCVGVVGAVVFARGPL